LIVVFKTFFDAINFCLNLNLPSEGGRYCNI